MENHPIPQDITGFQFKLIGNMTVRQFVYLAVGVILAWIFFILPISGIIRFPISITLIILGVSMAFVPIDGRPMDVMIINFIKALFKPTQYIYQKTGGNISQNAPGASPTSPQTQTPPAASPVPLPKVLITPPPKLTPPAPVAPAPAPQQPLMPASWDSSAPTPGLEPRDSVLQYRAQPVPAPKPVAPEPPLQAHPSVKIEIGNKPPDEKEIAEAEQQIEGQLSTLKKQVDATRHEGQQAGSSPQAATIHKQAADLEKVLAETVKQKEELEKELLVLKAKLDGKKSQAFAPSMGQAPIQTQNVRKIPAGMEKGAGIPNAPEAPNLITGIIKDPRGNPLPNILVEVKDQEDNPVRAFKTNGLGEFASATSLSNGKYILTFEDPKAQHRFDGVEIEATGAPIMPLEIISIDAREELRRELFN